MQKMKKKLLGLAVLAAFMVLGFAPATNALPPQTDVTGVITEKGNAVAGATVKVTCMGFERTDITDANGSYLVTFASVECPFGTTVKVTATKNGKSGSASGTVQGITTKLNIAIVNVSIPEYGWVGGVLAAGVGVGAIAFTRRRLAQQQGFSV